MATTDPVKAGMSESDARALWDDMRSGFVRLERLIVEIVENRAWEPLGYASFAEAWNDRMQGVRLATGAVKAHVVYALLEGGSSEAEAARILSGSGVSPSSVKEIAEKRASGIPATLVRSHTRRKPSAAAFARVELTASELAYFRGLSEARGIDMHGEMAKAIRWWFSRIERARGHDD